MMELRWGCSASLADRLPDFVGVGLGALKPKECWRMRGPGSTLQGPEAPSSWGLVWPWDCSGADPGPSDGK